MSATSERSFCDSLHSILKRHEERLTGQFAGPLSLPFPPLPCLKLTESGHSISLPLTQRDVTNIVSKSNTKNDRSSSNHSISSKHLTFTNQAWKQWIASTVLPAASQFFGTIGQDPLSVSLRHLRIIPSGQKLILEQKNIDPSVLGYVLVFLPSPFTGGDISFELEDRSISLSPSEESSSAISFMIYHDMATSKPRRILTGTGVVLTYRITASGNVSKASGTEQTISELRDIITQWHPAPDLLSHPFTWRLKSRSYSELDIYADRLDPSDRRVVDCLEQAAEDSPFSLFLLQIGCGAGSLPPSTADCTTEPLSKLDFFTEHGVPIDLETSFNFFSIQRTVDSTTPEENLDYFAFLCPLEEVTRLTLSPTVDAIMKAYLQRKTESDNLLAKEFNSKLMSWLDPASISEEDRVIATRAIIHYATRRRKSDLWIEAIRTSEVSIAALNQEDVNRAYKVFSGPAWEQFVRECLAEGQSNASRLSMLVAVVKASRNDPQLDLENKSNADRQMRHVLNRLDALDPDHDIQLLRALARTLGIPAFYRWFLSCSILTISLLPPHDEDSNVAEVTSAASSAAASSATGADTGRSRQRSRFDNALSAMPHIAAELAETVKPFSLNISADTVGSGLSDLDNPCPYLSDACQYARDVEQMVEFCHRIGYEKGIQTVIGKMSQSFKRFDEKKKNEILDSYLSPLLDHWVRKRRAMKTVGTRPLPLALKQRCFATLFKQAGEVLLSRGLPESPSVFQFFSFATRGGLVDELKTLLSSKISTIAKSNIEVLRSYANALETSKRVVTPDQLHIVVGLIEHLVTTILAHLNLRAITANDSALWIRLRDVEFASYSPYLRLSHLLEYCYNFQDQSLSLCERLLRRLHLPSGVNKKQYAIQNLLPSLQTVLSFIAAEDRALTLDVTADGALRDFIVGAFYAIVTYGLASETTDRIPDNVIKKLSCDCADCEEQVPNIFTGQEDSQFHLARLKRAHLEKRLEGSGLRDYGISWETIRLGSPHTLKITIPLRWKEFGEWLALRYRVHRLLKILGAPDKAKAVLGDYHVRIISGIGLGLPQTSLGEGGLSNPQKEGKELAPSRDAGSHGGKKRAASDTNADDVGTSSTAAKRIRLVAASES